MTTAIHVVLGLGLALAVTTVRSRAVRYWARAMRSPMGELCFAAHCRHAEPEMRALGDQVTTRLGDSPWISHLRQLLQAA